MTFKAALKRLNIEEYELRIFNSNSHGELAHLVDYIEFAKRFDDVDWFREWFIDVVKQAEKKWERPESVFQHMRQILLDHFIFMSNFNDATQTT